jgi:8-oxo-dGTP pyrophosphatase MutT (NUDIX family)
MVPFDLEEGVQAVYPAPQPKKRKKRKKKNKTAGPSTAPVSTVMYAGLVVRAEDSGRVLMLQRALDDDDETGGAGQWEWPGGHIEDGETPYAAAVREWQEEVGSHLPAGRVVDNWVSPAGTYEAFVYAIPAEAQVDLRESAIENPDGDYFESTAWFAPEHIPGMPALRDEVQQQTPWSKLRTPISAAKSAKDPAPHKGPLEHKVHDYLRKHYPEKLTAWVCRSAWEKNKVPLAKIAYHDRPGGRDEKKVERMMRQIRKGDTKKRVVLVDPGSAGKMVVADGYHRLMAMEKLGIKEARAWVGTPRQGAGNWRNDIRLMQVDVKNASGDENDDATKAATPTHTGGMISLDMDPGALPGVDDPNIKLVNQ